MYILVTNDLVHCDGDRTKASIVAFSKSKHEYFLTSDIYRALRLDTEKEAREIRIKLNALDDFEDAYFHIIDFIDAFLEDGLINFVGWTKKYMSSDALDTAVRILKYKNNADFSTIRGFMIPKCVRSLSLAFYSLETTNDKTFIVDFEKDSELENFSFYGSAISKVNLPMSIDRVPEDAFRRCQYIDTLYVPNSVKEIEQDAFLDSSIKKIHISDNITTIKPRVFNNCTHLEKVTGGLNVERIEKYAFSNCHSLKHFNFSNITNIEVGAFSLSGLEEVSFSKKIREINNYAFDNCADLKKISFAESFLNNNTCNKINIGHDAFNNSLIEKTEIANKGYFAANNILIFIPDITSEDSNSGIFYKEKDKYVMNIPEGITAILNNAIPISLNAKDIEVRLPSTLKHIAAMAFSGNYTIGDVVGGENIEYIGNHAFSHSSLKHFEIPKKVTRIEKGTFLDTCLTGDITIPKNIKFIGWGAYSDLENITSIRIEGARMIESYAFYGNFYKNNDERHIDLYLPKTIKTMGKEPANPIFDTYKTVFDIHYDGSADNWADISFGMKMSEFISKKSHVYFKNKLVTDIKFKKAHNIGIRAFSNFKDLEHVTFIEGTTLEEGAFLGCTNLKDANFEALDAIGKDAFRNCISIKSVTLNDKIRHLRPYVFKNVPYEKFVIPENNAIEHACASFFGNNIFEKYNSNMKIPENIKIKLLEKML